MWKDVCELAAGKKTPTTCHSDWRALQGDPLATADRQVFVRVR